MWGRKKADYFKNQFQKAIYKTTELYMLIHEFAN